MIGFFQQPISIYAALITLCLCFLLAQGIVLVNHITFDPRGRLGCLDGLRGFLALGVFFHHYVMTFNFHTEGGWNIPRLAFYNLSGHVGVILFFMVTGFLFWHKILVNDGRIDWEKLYISRFFRLVPLFWFMVLLVLAVVFIKGGFEMKDPLPKLLGHIIEWFAFVRYPDVNGFLNTSQIIAMVAWTLTYEWVFYTSLPFLAWVLIISKKRRIFIFFLMAFIIFLVAKSFPIKALDINTRFFVYFLAGAVTAYIYTLENWRKYLQSTIFSVLALASFLSVFLFFQSGYESKVAILLILFFIPVAMGNSFWGFLRLRPMVLLGEISYSLYLVHGFLLYGAYTLIFPRFMSAGTSSMALAVGMCVMGVLLVAVSYLTYSLIEKPGINFGKTLIRKEK